MGQPFPTQHPAVVLRSHFKLVSWLLAVAMAAVVALSVAVVIVSNDGDEIAAGGSSAAALPTPAVHAHPLETSAQAPGVRYDGGPEEGSRAIIAVPKAPEARYDGGPNEGTRAIATPAPAPAPERTTDTGSSETTSQIVIPMGPGGR